MENFFFVILAEMTNKKIMVKIFMVKATVDAFFNISISTAKKS